MTFSSPGLEKITNSVDLAFEKITTAVDLTSEKKLLWISPVKKNHPCGSYLPLSGAHMLLRGHHTCSPAFFNQLSYLPADI